MMISLILCTLGRKKDLRRFLASLVRQTSDRFEVILVDQNSLGYLDQIISEFSESIAIQRVWSEPGLSRARNVGLLLAKGDVIAFPDDDCWYPDTLIQSVEEVFLKQKVDGIVGRSIASDDGRATGVSGPKPSENFELLNKKNVWEWAISYTVFLRKEVTAAVGQFDEKLGVGAQTPWQSGEETDYLIRAMEEKYEVRACTDIFVYHPAQYKTRLMENMQRGLSYGRGMGRVLIKHNYSFVERCYYVIRPLAGSLFRVITARLGHASTSLGSALGRIQGLSSDPDDI